MKPLEIILVLLGVILLCYATVVLPLKMLKFFKTTTLDKTTKSYCDKYSLEIVLCVLNPWIAQFYHGPRFGIINSFILLAIVAMLYHFSVALKLSVTIMTVSGMLLMEFSRKMRGGGNK